MNIILILFFALPLLAQSPRESLNPKTLAQIQTSPIVTDLDSIRTSQAKTRAENQRHTEQLSEAQAAISRQLAAQSEQLKLLTDPTYRPRATEKEDDALQSQITLQAEQFKTAAATIASEIFGKILWPLMGLVLAVGLKSFWSDRQARNNAQTSQGLMRSVEHKVNGNTTMVSDKLTRSEESVARLTGENAVMHAEIIRLCETLRHVAN